MANTERLNALQMVTEARREVGEARSESDLTATQQQLLDDVYDELVDLEDALIHEDIKASIKKLEKGAEALTDLTGRMKRSVQSVKSLAKKVETATKAVAVLAEIVAKAVSAGLL
jgi:cell division septum initiation protein DivIVA